MASSIETIVAYATGYDRYNSTAKTNAVSNTQSTPESGENNSQGTETSISMDHDTVTISQKGAELAKQSLTSEDTESYQLGSQSSSETLSQYTESELLQMLNKGEITQAEYNEELRSRKGIVSIDDEE